MAQLKDHEKDMIRIARSVIRDMAHGWSISELSDDPARVCQGLSVIVGDTYDFESGNVTCVTTNDSGDQHFPEDDR
jgi:hypothetical protein